MILVTGADGFVGNAIIRRLSSDGGGAEAVAATRSARQQVWPKWIRHYVIGDISTATNLRQYFDGVSAIVHSAGRAHVMKYRGQQSIDEFRRVNVDGAVSLARQAAHAGVKRMVYVSSVKVNGDVTRAGKAFFADDVGSPSCAYSLSKLEAEEALGLVSRETGLELVIVRPPLVYGPTDKGNFASLIKLLQIGLPLPLAGISNSRSLVAVDNLADLLIVCARNPRAAGEVFLVSDGEDVSTPELLRRTAHAMRKKIQLYHVPRGLLELGTSLVGKRSVFERLCMSLQVNIDKTQCLLDWTPPLSLDQGLEIAVSGLGA